ncbi:MAG TPA: hypothetical protein DCQ28_14505 [Bacteroidetes bacterium]|nr:hypothetical protein [Bacteroidota bacterium]
MMAAKLNISTRIFWSLLFVMMYGGLLFSQTAPNAQIINQAKAVYTFKTFPADTIRSNTTQFTVLDARNFELSFGSTNAFVFAKETVVVRLVYKNIGNKKADTASIEGVLPPAGLRFVPGSTKGVITGNTVTWKVFAIEPNQTDSVAVKAVVDSNVIVSTELQLNGAINWLSSSVNSNHTFTVSSFPRLALSITTSSAVVGSGRTISYLIAVKNSGNIPSNNTVLYDTISNLGTFVNSTILPDSISADKRLLKWNIGTIPAFGERIISLTVLTVPNLSRQNITNSAFTFSSGGTEKDNKKVSNDIVPIAPKTIFFTSEPMFIFGKVNADSSKIDIIVKDSVNMVLPDGVIVQLAVSFGTFSNNTASLSTTIQNGKVSAYIRSADVTNEIVRVKITATAGAVASGTIQDTTNIFMYPGAVTGVVVNGASRSPFAGAIAQVYNQNNIIVGADTTKSNGRFFIPLNKDVAKYKLKIFVIDRFGDSISTTSEIDPRLFPLPPIVIPNIIAGRILYRVSNQPVAAEGATVFLDSVSQSNSRSLRGSGNIKKIAAQNSLARVSEQVTDKDGKFKFENLIPARYLLSVDSSQFPSFQGYSYLTDTVSGTFTINLAIEIQLDSSLTINTNVQQLSNAKDTLIYTVVLKNTGNTEHYSASVIDTLPAYTSFIEAQKGNFDSVRFDGTKGIITWIQDTVKTTESDTLTFSLLLSDNMPDDTKIRNSVWFNSQSFKTNSFAITTVRSKALLDFRNTFSVLKDSIVAGDSIRNVLWFKNTGTDSLRNVRIVDTIYSAGMTRLSLAIATDSTKIVDSVLTVYFKSIPPGKEDSVTLKLVTDFTLKTGYKIISSAHLMKGDSSLVNRKDSLVMIENSNVSTFLTVLKTANKKVAEIGDVVTYQIQISNSSPQFVSTIGVYDIMPYAFRYVKNSARFNGKAVEPTFNSTLNQMEWLNLSDTIQSGKSGYLVYQLAVSADALESEGLNTVHASAVSNGGIQLVSAPSYWQIDVRPGVFTNKGLIIGKVFYDDNRNTFQDEGENGVKDIELWLEDGTKIITGDDGKFSLPEVKPGQHVMRVNERTLPKNSELLIGDNAFAKDPTSRFIRVTDGGIAKANFFLKRNIGDSLWQSLSKMNRLISARQAKPKYVYEDTVRKIKIDTVEMFVTFSYSGTKYAQSISIFDVVSDKFALVPNSASYNGKRINPVVFGKNIQWNLGRGKDVGEGVLRYKVRLTMMPTKGTVLQSTSTIKILFADTSSIESKNIFVENIVLDMDKNKIETSDIAIKTVAPAVQTKMSDSVLISAGDEVFFKISLFIDPKKKIKSVKLLDSLESAFIINERSFTVNNIPLPSNNLSLKVRSSSFSMASTMMRDEMEFVRIASVNLTEFLRKGLNEITYSAKFQSAAKDTVYRKTSSAVIKNEFNEENFIRAKDTKIFVKASNKYNSVALETSYVDIQYLSTKVEEKIADAIKLVESLRQNNAKAVVMEGITFELGKATLTRESMNILDKISQLLIENSDIKIQVNGYTDNTGNASSNRKMSLYRAKEVTTYLIAKGIDPKRLIAQGFGSNNPITSNKTVEGRAKNRRVEFARMK